MALIIKSCKKPFLVRGDEFGAPEIPADYEEGDDVFPSGNWLMKYPRTGDGPYVGTGRVIPDIFIPLPGYTPQRLFLSWRTRWPQFVRYCNRKNRAQGLIYTDGACLDNGNQNARGGCAFVYKDPEPGSPHAHYCSFPLEDKGPTGEKHPQTSNRAELRAVIAALRFRVWSGEGFTSMVIATDSEYVAIGATRLVRTWVERGWKTSNGKPVKNKDLWLCLLGEVERWDAIGFKILFWRIPREQNTVADQCAKRAAADALAKQDTDRDFTDIWGVGLFN